MGSEDDRRSRGFLPKALRDHLDWYACCVREHLVHDGVKVARTASPSNSEAYLTRRIPLVGAPVL